MKKILGALFILLPLLSIAQVTKSQNELLNKEYSKDISLYRGKHFLFSEVLGTTEKIARVEIVPLAAANSGELTTLLYKSSDKEMEGMIIGFYNDHWNDFGLTHQLYSFRNFTKESATNFLNIISDAIENNKSYLREDRDNNNIFFKFEDIEILITSSVTEMYIRVFWKDYDATWERTAFDRSKRRFERKIK